MAGYSEDWQATGLKRSEVLLLLIEERCFDGRHWVPKAGSVYLTCLNLRIVVYGAGDMGALNALLRKGLIRRVEATHGFEITEEGRLVAQTLA